MKKFLPLFLLFLLGLGVLNAAVPSERCLVRIANPDRALMEKLANDDIASMQPGHYVDLIVSPDRYQQLSEMGYALEIRQTESQARAQLTRDIPGYYSYDNMVDELQTLAAAFPDIMRLYDIGDSWGKTYADAGNTNYTPHDLWAVKVSDNPDVEEDEPCIFYMGTHHAREPLGMQCCMNLLTHYLNGYGSDPTITDDINNKQIWFIPLVNPDGEQIVLDGVDSWWRKNVRDNNGNGSFDTDHASGTGTDGVDPNRNYGFTWGSTGAADDFDGETYHGPNEFSEPETQAVRDLILAHHFVAGISFHTYGEEVLTPYGYANDTYGPDNTSLYALGDAMASSIPGISGGHYTNEMSWALYPTNGGSDDWVYGVTGAFSYTIEMGTQFIPPQNQVQTICDNNINASMILAHRIDGASITGHVTDATTGQPIRAEVYVDGVDNTGAYRYPILADSLFGRYYRILEPGTYNVTFRLDGYLSKSQSVTIGNTPVAIEVALYPTQSATLTGHLCDAMGNALANATVTMLASQRTTTTAADGSFSFDNVSYGDYQLQLTKSECGTIVRAARFSPTNTQFVFAMDSATYNTNFENGISEWTVTGQWALTTSTAQSPTHSLTDSPNGQYNNNSNTYARITQAFDFSNVHSGSFGFWLKYDLEEGYDYLYVEYQIGSGTWTSIFSVTGTDNDWAWQSIALDALYGASSVKFRFHLSSDQGVTADGVYIDNVSVFTDGTTPAVLFGDVNADGSINTVDAVTLLDCSLGNTDGLTPCEFLAGDVDADGRLTAFDASLAIQYVLGTITLFPVVDPTYITPSASVNVTCDGHALQIAANGNLYSLNLSASAPGFTGFGSPIISGEAGSTLLHTRQTNDFYGLALYSGVAIPSALISLPYTPQEGAGVIPLFLNVNGVDTAYYFDTTQGVVDQTQPVTRLVGNYPNPFNPTTTIAYNLQATGQATVQVFNLRGQLVRTLVDEPQTAGAHQVTWNGTDNQGHGVASGVYFYRLLTRDGSQQHKMLLLK